MNNQNENLKTRRLARAMVTIGAAAFIPLLAPWASAITAVEASAPGVAISDGASGAVAMQFTPGVADILRMVDAKVDPGIVRAFVNNSSVAYSLPAGEIIALKQHGVPDEVITAMIQRGGELRAQPAQGAQPRTAPATPPAYDYGAQPATYTDYAGGYPSYGYGGYPSYAYGSYYNYGYPWAAYWPYYSWPFFSCGFYPYYGYGYCGYGYRGYGYGYGYCRYPFYGHYGYGYGHYGYGHYNNSYAHSGGIYASGPGRGANTYSHSVSTSQVRYSGGNMHAQPYAAAVRTAPGSMHSGGYQAMGSSGYRAVSGGYPGGGGGYRGMTAGIQGGGGYHGGGGGFYAGGGGGGYHGMSGGFHGGGGGFHGGGGGGGHGR